MNFFFVTLLGINIKMYIFASKISINIVLT